MTLNRLTIGMVHQRVTRINHRAAIGIPDCIVGWLTAVPSRKDSFNMLRRYAVAHAVYKARQRDEVRPCLVSNNQTFGYLHLILRWSAGGLVLHFSHELA